MIGQTISHYQIKRELGRGGMGVVYLAEDLRLGRLVAIKALPTELSRDPLRRKRFEQEARACAVLNHSSIAAVFDLEEVGEELFIVFEYVDGEDLRALLRRGPLPVQQLLKFAGSIARGLAFAHQAGIIHRDLKPENIRVNTSGETKILDFGLARMQPELLNAAATFSFAITQQGNIVGTVGYMSPEQLESRELDARSDIFSLGVILYEMAAGVHPFQGESPASTIANVLTKDPAPVEHLNPVQPPALDLIIRKCLAKKKEQRYQSVGELLLELEDIQRKSDDAMKTVVIAPATTTLPAMDPDSVLAKSFARLMPNVRGWWEMHHIFMAVIILGMFPTLAWQMRGSLGGQLDLFFFFVVVIFAMIHFVFRAGMVLTVLFNRARQAETIQNLGPVVRLTHILLCLSVLFAAPKFVGDHPLLGTVFAGIVVGGILVSLAIEPWMERTAFPQLAELREELLRNDEASSTRGARKWWLVHHLSAMLGWSPMVAVLPWLVREWLPQQNNVPDFIVFLCILFAVQNFGFRAYVLEVAWFHREALEATVAKMATPILLCNLALVALCATISTMLFKAHSLQSAGFMVMAVGAAMIVGLLEPNFNRYAFPRRDDDSKSTGKKLEMDDITRLGLMQLVYLFPATYLVVNAAPELLSGGATWSSRLKYVGPTVSWIIGVMIMLALVAVVFLAATSWGLLVQRRADIVVTFRKYFLMFVVLDIGGMAASITISAGDRYILPALALIAAMFYGIRYQWILVNRIAPPLYEGRFKWDHVTSLTAVQLPYIASYLYLLGGMLQMMDKVPMWISQPKPSDDLYGFFVFTVMSTAGALILGSLAWALWQRRPDVVRTFKRWFILFALVDLASMQGGMLALARNTNLFILLLGATAMLYGIRYQWLLAKHILAADDPASHSASVG